MNSGEDHVLHPNLYLSILSSPFSSTVLGINGYCRDTPVSHFFISHNRFCSSFPTGNLMNSTLKFLFIFLVTSLLYDPFSLSTFYFSRCSPLCSNHLYLVLSIERSHPSTPYSCLPCPLRVSVHLV